MPMYKSPIRSLNQPAPMSSLSGASSQFGSPLEEAAYLRGKMRAQEFILKRQDVETTQSRLMAAQDEAERRNAAREELAQNRFEQAQKEAAARAAAQESQQERILGHQQWMEKRLTEKDIRDIEDAKKKEAADAEKVAREIEAIKKKDEAIAKKEADAEALRVAEGRISRAILGSGMKIPDNQAKGLVAAYVVGTPDEQAGILKYVEDLGKHQTAKTQYEKAIEALSIVDQSKTAPDRWYREGKVWVDKNAGPGVLPSLVSTEVAKRNPNLKLITTDESGQTLIGGVPVVAPEEPKLTFGGMVTADAPVKSPNAPMQIANTAPTSPMSEAAAPMAPEATGTPQESSVQQVKPMLRVHFIQQYKQRFPDADSSEIMNALNSARSRGLIL